jgi:uncharacterized protein YqeY
MADDRMIGPIIKIEMQQVRESVMHYMQQRNEELNAMVQETLEQTLTEEWVKVSIQDSVNSVVQKAIDNVGENFQFRCAVEKAIGDALAKMVNR